MAVHGRPPAFTGVDGRAYSADLFVDSTPAPDGQFGAALFFVRWSPDGERPDGHVETESVAFGPTPQEARRAARALTLFDVKRLLDIAITAQGNRPEW
ncbi:MAG TPA: hypothetical protein VNL18_09575, partial [Gemmatimonadales bacterium]|nr:hypothetical protein [Gemmatimonadales bacterium]